MKKHLLTILFVLGLSAAVAMAQSTAPGQVPSAAEGAPGSMQQPDRSGAAAQSGAQTQPSDSYGSMDKDSMDKDKKQSSMANVDDESLHRQVHEQLASNPDLQNVQITVKNGKVTLEGTVPKKEDKKEAERLAKAVPGVKGIKDKLSVNASAGSSGSASNTGGVSGAATTTGSAAGENKSAESGQGIAAQTTTTTTTTSGSTTGASESGQAGATPSSTPPSSASAQSAAAPADQSSMSAGASATTGGVSGQATENPSLANPDSGAAGSISSQSSASSQAGTAGQTSDPSSQSSMGAQSQSGSMGSAAADDQLQQQIQTALKNDPSLANDAFVIVITTDAIDLSGDVATGKEKKTAQRITESYAGNRKVKNNISVGGKGAGAKDSTTPSAIPKSDQKPPQN